MKIWSNWIALLLAVNLLVSCSAPVGQAEILPITEQATVTGVYAVKVGAEPLGKIFENVIGTQIVVWPGAQVGREFLWNFACLVRCPEGWSGELVRYIAGPGRTTTWMKMSEFVSELKANGWVEISSSSAVANFAQATRGIITGFMVVPVFAVPTEVTGPIS